MSAQSGETTIYGGIGFVIVLIKELIENVGPEMESFFHGALGAVGAIIVKLLYELAKNKVEKYKQKKKDGKVE